MAQTKPKKVPVVDDSANFGQLCSSLLEEEGREIEAVPYCLEAMEAFERIKTDLVR